jgi:hypothetical protein
MSPALRAPWGSGTRVEWKKLMRQRMAIMFIVADSSHDTLRVAARSGVTEPVLT